MIRPVLGGESLESISISLYYHASSHPGLGFTPPLKDSWTVVIPRCMMEVDLGFFVLLPKILIKG
jgi:hypothetical protein